MSVKADVVSFEPFKVLLGPALILAIPEFRAVCTKSPVPSNCTFPNWDAPALTTGPVVVLSTFPTMAKPVPRVMSSTVPVSFVPFKVLIRPGFNLIFVMAAFFTIGNIDVPVRSPSSFNFPSIRLVALLITGTLAVLLGSKSPAN